MAIAAAEARRGRVVVLECMSLSIANTFVSCRNSLLLSAASGTHSPTSTHQYADGTSNSAANKHTKC
jgi:hypothetical protein